MAADLAPVLGLAGLILVKEIGVPVPVPGDLVVLGAGVAASRGDLDPVVALTALILASILGGTVQFALLRSVARPAIVALLTRFGASGRFETETERLRRSGVRGVATARLTPGVRIVAIAASALAAIPAPVFLVGLVIGNGLFIAAHFALGFVLGEPIVALIGAALGPIALVVVLAAVGVVAWLRLSARRGAGLAPVAAWADACCPACLALAATGARSA